MFNDWRDMSNFLKVITIIPIVVDVFVKVYKFFKKEKKNE